MFKTSKKAFYLVEDADDLGPDDADPGVEVTSIRIDSIFQIGF